MGVPKPVFVAIVISWEDDYNGGMRDRSPFNPNGHFQGTSKLVEVPKVVYWLGLRANALSLFW